jgi:hypothetical protein
VLRVLIAHSPRQVIAGSLDQEGERSKEQLAQRVQGCSTSRPTVSSVLGVSATEPGRTARRLRQRHRAIRRDRRSRAGADHGAVGDRSRTADTDVASDHGLGAAARSQPPSCSSSIRAPTSTFHMHPDADRAWARAIEYPEPRSRPGVNRRHDSRRQGCDRVAAPCGLTGPSSLPARREMEAGPQASALRRSGSVNRTAARRAKQPRVSHRNASRGYRFRTLWITPWAERSVDGFAQRRPLPGRRLKQSRCERCWIARRGAV